MAKFTGIDKAVRARLAAEVAGLEVSLAMNPGMNPGMDAGLRAVLTRLIDDCSARIGQFDEAEKIATAEQRQAEQREIVLAAAQREHALTLAEQKQYSEFLGKEFFTRADFGKLEEFYKSAWDRLSEDGKAEMSHRIWEGVRRDEYKFSELPDIVKQKESQRLYEALSVQKNLDESLQKIPQSDRDDFTEAWKAGKKEEAYQILNRSSFAENVALKAVAETASITVAKSKTKEAVISEARNIEKPAKPSPPNSASDVDFGLGDLKLKDDGGAKVSAPLPLSPSNGSKGKGQ